MRQKKPWLFLEGPSRRRENHSYRSSPPPVPSPRGIIAKGVVTQRKK